VRHERESRSRPHRRYPNRSRLVGLLLVALPLLIALPSAADTIHLTNGRTIRTESARIEGDRVIFRQYGGEVTIPLSSVARIVADDEVQRPSSAAAAPPAAPQAPAAPAEAEPPSLTADYWIKRIRAADERIARVQAELDLLPYYDDVDQRLLRFSGQARHFMAERAKWEAMMRRFQATRRQLLEGARKAGIPPGALRDGLRR